MGKSIGDSFFATFFTLHICMHFVVHIIHSPQQMSKLKKYVKSNN